MAGEERVPDEDEADAAGTEYADEEGKDDEKTEAEQAREERLADETRVAADEARENAAADEQNPDNHRDVEPFES